LAGTAKEVWVPDLQTQQRRDCFHAYAKSTKRTTQMRARIRSYLSDNGVRLPQTLCLTQTQEAQERIFKAKQWSACQQELIAMMLEDLRHAHDQRQRWRSLIAREVAADPLLLSLVRLCGVRDIIAFALGAFIGDINRFANPKKLVSYVGLHPAFDDSGQSQWSGGIGGHGHKLLRSLLIEGAQAILRSAHHPMAKWGKRLLASKGSANVAVAAMARKLTVAVWYLMMGRWTPLTDIDSRLMLKVGKIISAMGRDYLKRSGQKRHVLRKNIYERLKFGRTYVVKMHKPPGPAAPRPGLRIRSGLRMRSNLAED
jgi:transposase